MASFLVVNREEEEQCYGGTAALEQATDGICELLSAVGLHSFTARRRLISRQISASVAAGPKALSEAKRKEVIEAACQLQEAMETAEEKVFRIMSMPNDATALVIAADMNLFDIAAGHIGSTGEAIAVSDLAAMSGADIHFLPRILRFLAGHGLMIEVAEDRYQVTDAGRLLLNDQPLGGMVLAMSMSLLPLGNMLQYFRRHGFQNPSESERGPWQYAHGSDRSFFRWLEGKPKEKKAFHLAMAGLRPNAACQWFEHFRVREKLLVSGSRMSLVDVGGGMGHDAKRAKAYYMRMILHDWPEKQAQCILAKVRQAMSEDSLLLINEIVLPEKGISLYEARMDFLMMAFCAGMERTERQWTELLRGAGFVIRSIWTCGATRLIEAALDTV
ncbi:S-adenosyl-L-methionine-dependent methyltransferase [Periconia macrospinosa]|uniref:S-adenosyl-L-methionine-dependent methyltransferase n=1 Tax=Periconia macrospinosa TaxID=97972 RepID=A0A2V1D067_9PLEO|nr:S-adenosyl-L-methionine-dependent methyltransferase [Periconia macrospinosa]